MGLTEVVILAVVQGLTEFLPVSSSGHLVLAGHWLGVDEAKGTLNIMLHAGTLLSIIVFHQGVPVAELLASRHTRLIQDDVRVLVGSRSLCAHSNRPPA